MDTLKHGDTIMVGHQIKKFDLIDLKPSGQKMIRTMDGGCFNALFVKKLVNDTFVSLNNP